MRIFKNKWFHRFANKEGISDSELKEVAKHLESGQYYADLGGSVYKMQLARPNEGKSGGFRVLVFCKIEERILFHYGFPKSVMDNINRKELKIMKRQAKAFFILSNEQIDGQIANADLFEII
ncbi:MAG: type II toxin-antitoxin system RelE/ParE family toxin [Treponema sp.]|nr:type II toxin-antitoxin system RelE/ParE family toxin [Treponema sp.]